MIIEDGKLKTDDQTQDEYEDGKENDQYYDMFYEMLPDSIKIMTVYYENDCD